MLLVIIVNVVLVGDGMVGFVVKCSMIGIKIDMLFNEIL